MIRNSSGLAAALALALLVASNAGAQNVSGYDSIPNPYLLLLREPAVHDDLSLSPEQREHLQQLNDKLDGPLLALRNLAGEKAEPKLAELIRQTRSGVDEVLTRSQRERLGQIMLRVRGIRVVLTPQVAERLRLSDRQRESIEEALAKTGEEIEALAGQLESGTPRQEVERQALAARQREQRRVLGELTDGQKRLLADVLGRPFDPARLGRARFKAPELVDSGVWINSGPVRLADLRGQVVAVHFFAFGCINCQCNYPWYRQWYEALADRGLRIVGIHTPETKAERDVDMLRSKVEEAGFRFPVLADNAKRNWNAWGNSMWPSVYLVDKRGYIRYWWYGELNWKGAGGQEIMAGRIEELLAE
jgi:peroxiredoxin